MRKLDFHDFGARRAKNLGGLRNTSLHFVGKAGSIHESRHDANAHAFDALLARRAEIGLHVLRSAVHGIMAANGVHGGSGIANAARERANLVKRAAERDDAITRNHAIGRLHANNAAERCGLANGTARVGTERDARKASRDRRRRAAGTTTRDALKIPRVFGGTERGGLGGAAECEFVHIELAQRNAARLNSFGNARRRIRRDVILEHAGRTRGVRALIVHVVFECHGHASERAHFIEGAVCERLVDFRSLFESGIFRELQECMHFAIEFLDALEACLSDFARREIARQKTGTNVGHVHIRVICHY